MKQLFNRISELGVKNNLCFSSHELLENAIIALDGIQGKLLVINGITTDQYDEILIDLQELKSCSLKKEYGAITTSDLKEKKLEQLLDKISLQFEFRNNKEPMEVPFYEHSESDNLKVSELELKAKHWGIMLSKMLRNSKAR